MKQPLISVLVPAYNHERFVQETIRSVLAQDWPRIELVIIDDGSTDCTRERIEALREECEGHCERFVFHAQENQGICATWNRLADEARGDYVGIIASDDIYLPGALSSLVKPMLNDSSIGLVVGENELMDGEGRRCYWDSSQHLIYDERRARYRTFNERIRHKANMRTGDASFGTYAALARGNHIANGYLIRRSALDRVLPFRREAPLEDWWLHLQLSKVARYQEIGAHTFRYRWHAGNSIKQMERIERMTVQTLLWEQENVRTMADTRWRELFEKATITERTIFSLGPVLGLLKRKSIGKKQRVLRLFSHEYMLSECAYGLEA